MKTTETSTPSFYIQNPSGIRYLIREITSSTQHIVFNHLAYDPGTPVSARPFFYGAKLPAGSRLQVTSSGDTGAIEFSLVVEALPS